MAWLKLKLAHQTGMEEFECYVGSTFHEKVSTHIPVAFLPNSSLKNGWMEVRRVFESSPRGDSVLFFEEYILGFIAPEHWYELLQQGKTTCIWESPGFSGVELLEK